MPSGTRRAFPVGPRRRARQVGVAIAAAAVLVLHLSTPLDIVGQVTYVAFTGGGAVVALVAARRMAGPAARPWCLLAVGLMASALGDVYWGTNLLAAPPTPDVSPADIGWLGAYGFIIAALFGLLRHHGGALRDDLEGLIDTGVALTVSLLVLGQLVVAPVLGDTSTTLVTRLVWASYPALDAVLLALVLRMVISRRTTPAVGALLLSGLLWWLVSDLASNVVELTGFALSVADTGWMIGPVLIGLAAWVAARSPRQTRHPAGDRSIAQPISHWRIVFSAAPLTVPAGLELWGHHRGIESPGLTMIGTVVLAALVAARMMLFLRSRDDAARQVASSERYYRALAANSADAVLVLDAAGRVRSDSPRLAELLGRPGTSIRGITALSAVCAQDAPNAADLHARALSSPGAVFAGELRLETLDGSAPWLAVRVVNLLDDPDVHGIVVNFHEIGDRKVAEGELVRLAFYDSLTGLANRALFLDRVDHVLETAGVDATAVLFLDLDGFKDVNDGLGHDAGDEVLRHVATRLMRSARPGDTVARLSGDEFAILLEQCDHPGVTAENVADRILRELTAPMELAEGPVRVSASIGIAVPDHLATGPSLLRDADVAMYAAKVAGRGRRILYAPAMREATLERLRLVKDLAHALDGGQLRVVYQPVVELASGSIEGFEALLRWDHPVFGLIPPDRFIPLAEESGLIIPIGAWVLENACQMAAIWQEHHHRPDLTMAVNVSGRQLASSDLVVHVEDALAASGLPAASLVLEMTETVLVEDPVAAASRLRQLRRLGLRLAIDDFGTGYSSLSYLSQFPIDILKIDASFVNEIVADEPVPPLVHALFELGHTLKLEMVAEGIETIGQLNHLLAERCPLGQGFLFSRPVDAHVASALLTEPAFSVAASRSLVPLAAAPG